MEGLLGRGPHGCPLLPPTGFDLIGVWELGISTLLGGKGYSSFCLTEIKFRATGYPSRTENQSV